MSDRDERGRLLPGHHSPGPGRPKREQEAALLSAISSAIPPAEVASALRTALDLAIELRSPRGIVSVLEFQAAYQLGKPIARVENIEGDPISETLEKLQQMYIARQQVGQAEQG